MFSCDRARMVKNDFLSRLLISFSVCPPENLFKNSQLNAYIYKTMFMNGEVHEVDDDNWNIYMPLYGKAISTTDDTVFQYTVTNIGAIEFINSIDVKPGYLSNSDFPFTVEVASAWDPGFSWEETKVMYRKRNEPRSEKTGLRGPHKPGCTVTEDG